MSKSTSTFSAYYDIQESWLRKQVKDLKDDSFIDLDLAREEIENAGITAFANHAVIDKFREEHLSKRGKDRLSSALRTYKKRENRRLTTRRLDIDISVEADTALKVMVKESGLTKIEFLEQLILKEREKQNYSL
ncbi:hypothetical protein ACR30L_16190 [Psychromonas sp. PT13]|uniref:hypothetical protein n=1 Tax=Psychromonas sp. PT13 TaxID=3439547 RepID=UPI003EB8303D